MQNLNKEWELKGYIDEKIDSTIDIAKEIKSIAKEKNAIILAHYYVDSKIQDIADFIGDSLALARKAANTNADIILMAGVHFMAETCKILCPEKKVLCPDINAGCSLADSCKAEDLEKLKQENPDYKVISYVNTTSRVKALTDIVVTSGNAKKIVEKLPPNENIIFCPDYNLGNYINNVTGRNMLLWNGGCHVHERFSSSEIIKLKNQHPQALVLVHPECKDEVIKVADVVGSTAFLLDYCSQHPEKEYIVVTETGILYEMKKRCPTTNFYVVPYLDEDSQLISCNECEYMKKISLQKVYNTIKYEYPFITVPHEIAIKAKKSIDRMLSMS